MSDQKPVSKVSSIPLSALVGLSGILVMVVFGFFAAGAPIEHGLAISLLIAGVCLMCFPPQFRPPWWVWMPALLLFLLLSLAFLPGDWAAKPHWRKTLEANGLQLGDLIQIHVGQGLEYLIRVVIGLVLVIYLFAQRVSSRWQHWLLLAFCISVAAYSVVSMLMKDLGWVFPWDKFPSFGFFPNHNLSATVLVMGALCGLGVTFQFFKLRKTALVSIPLLATALCVWPLFFHSGTRMGPVLLAIGGLTWLVSLGAKQFTPRMIVFTTFAIVFLGGCFFLADTTVKSRLIEAADKLSGSEKIAANEASVGDFPRKTGTIAPAHFDIRFAIYADVMDMIKGEPWTGVGLGMFEFVFPQYRTHSASAALCLHPESDWFWVASESGLAAAVLLAVTVTVIFFLAVKARIGRHSWPLDSACLIAAAVVPIHGLVDIPGHSSALALSAVWLVVMTLREREGEVRAGMWLGACFRLAGLLMLCIGGYLIFPAKGNVLLTPISQTKQHADQALNFFQLYDTARKASPQTDLPTAQQYLNQAIFHVDQALATTPMDEELHYQKGILAIHHLGINSITDQAFVMHRLLAPYKAGIAERQAAAWWSIDLGRAFSLYSIAINNADKPGSYYTREEVYKGLLNHCNIDGEKLYRAFLIAADEEPLLNLWVDTVPISSGESLLPYLWEKVLDQDITNRLRERWEERKRLRMNQ